MRHLRWAIAGIAALCSLAAPALAQTAGPNLGELLKPDPGVVMGVLPNGLRYAIKQHASHQREVIYLNVAAGSLDETNDERGVAHFLEHIAFNGSKNFPADSLIKTFENAGIGFGRDQNAFTTYYSTTFTLGIPNVTDEKLDLSFRWLRDVGDGLLIAPDEVNRERGVVMSEYRTRLGPGKTVGEEIQRFVTPNMRPIERDPVGVVEVINTADAAKIRAFYERWYRPDSAIVIAVGDEPVEKMRARIIETFSSWRSDTARPAHPAIGSVDFNRAGDIGDFSEAHLSSRVNICRFMPKTPHRPEDVGMIRERLEERIWSAIFAERMARQARLDNAPFLAAGGGYSVGYRTFGEACFTANPRVDDWRSALAALDENVRRLELYGITQKEFDETRSRIVTDLDAAVVSASNQTPDNLASSILSNMVDGDTFDTLEEQRRVTLMALQEMGPKDVLASLHRRWTEASPPLVLVQGPAAVAKADIASAWTLAQSAPQPSAPVDPKTAAWVYGDVDKAGAVVSRVELKDPDFTRLTFANGLVVNFKQTAFLKNQVSIHILFGAGQQEIAPGHAFDATMGGTALFSGAYARNTLEDVTQVCLGHACSAALSVGRDYFELLGATRPADLDLELQVLTGLLVEPGFRPNMATAMPTVAASTYRLIRVSPGGQAALKLAEALPKPHLADLPPEAHIAGLTAADFASLLKVPLTQDPLEVTIVGDVDEASAMAAVSKTLGALPPRTPGDRARGDAIHTTLGTPPAPLTAFHEGSGDQAVVLLSWPLYVWAPERVHEGRVLGLMTRMMQDAVTEQIRQKLGKSYTPSVGASVSRGGDQGSLGMAIQTSPDATDAVREAALGIAADFAAGRLTDDALEQARKPVLEAQAKQRTFNNWWIGVMDGSNRHPEQLRFARESEADVKGITLDEVKAEARRWLSATPYIVTALPQPAKTAVAAVDPAKPQGGAR